VIEKKDDINTNFEREIRIAENLHKEEMEKVLQDQKDNIEP
jgi:hypothetical protein